MSALFSCRQVGDVVIVDASGRITLGEGSTALREQIQKLVYGRPLKPWDVDIPPSKKVNILLNLGDVSYMDSSGLGGLICVFSTVTNAGGMLKLLSLCKRVQDLLEITDLYTDFEVFDDEAAAISSFARH